MKGSIPIETSHEIIVLVALVAHNINLMSAESFENTRKIHDDVIKWYIFRVTGHLCGEFTGHWWIPRTKTSGVELWYFLLFAPE